MRIGKLWMTALLGVMPVVAQAQPGVDINAHVGVQVDDAYDTDAPGAPIEAVDVFYDQLSPYGVWVDEPELGRVFIPDTGDFVPYRTGHWIYTSIGFVWVSNEPFAWATYHYGRWAFSSTFGRWIWMPDTQWGPAWVEWRQTGTEFGWAPLAPEVFIRIGYQPPIESWRYCGAEHILDVNVTRYYEPRDRVVVIHRQARPIEHFTTVSNVRVSVGPPPSVLREHRVNVRPVKVEARAVGRWSPAEAHTLVTKADEHKATFEVQNQRRIEQRPKIREVQTKVVDTHPAIKAQVTARAQATHTEPARVEPKRNEPARVEPKAPLRNEAPAPRAEPKRNEPARVEPKAPQRPEPQRAEPKAPQRPEPKRAEPKPPERTQPPQRVEPRAPQRTEPQAPAQRAEPKAQPAPRAEPKAQPAPQRAEPKAQPAPRAEPKAPPAPRAEPPRAEQKAPPPAPRAEPRRAEPKAAPPPQHPEPPHGDQKHK